MAADGVVAVQPPERGQAGVAFVGKRAPALQSLAFEGGVERLGQGVVGGAADGAHRLPDPGYSAGSSEVLRCILGSVIAVEDRSIEAAPGPLRGGEGVGDQAGAHVVGDRPAREGPGVQIYHGGQVEEPALADGQIRDGTDVTLVDRGGGEVPPDQIRRLDGGGIRDGGLYPAS